MKATGIIRKIDELGRFVIPKEIRDTMGITEHDYIAIFVKDDEIILKKHEVSCTFCKKHKPEVNLAIFKNKLICEDCLNELKA